MKCPRCNQDWPQGTKFCEACGTKLQTKAMGGVRVVAAGQMVEKVRSILSGTGLGKVLEPLPGHFVIQKGSTHVEVRVLDLGFGKLAIRSSAPVTIETPISLELLQFLLHENATLLLGAFGLGARNEIVYSHTIMGSSVDAIELGASVSAVVNTADKYDDEIVQRWGGKTRRQVALQQAVAPALLKALTEPRAAVAGRRANPSPPAPQPVIRQQPPSVADAIKVGSVAEEYMFLARQRCQCGGEFNCEAQALLEVKGLHYDRLELSCKQCGMTNSFLFDINSFLKN